MKKKEKILLHVKDLKNPKKVELLLKKSGREAEIDIIRSELRKQNDSQVYVVVKNAPQKISSEILNEFRLELSLQQAILSGAFEAIAKTLKK